MRQKHVLALGAFVGLTLGAVSADAFYATKVNAGKLYSNLTIVGGGGFNDNISNCDNCGKWVRFSDVVDFSAPNLTNGFPYYGERFAFVYITSNGYVVLRKDQPPATPLPAVLTEDPAVNGFGMATSPTSGIDPGQANALLPSYMIGPMFDDWDTTGTTATGGDVIYGSESGSTGVQCLTVQWRKVRYHGATGGDGNGFSFALLMCKDGSIEYLYGDVSDGSASGGHDLAKSAAIGFQYHLSTVAERWSYNTTAVTSNTGFRWTYPGANSLYIRATDWNDNKREAARAEIIDANASTVATIVTAGAASAWRRFNYAPAPNPTSTNNYKFDRSAKVVLTLRDANDKPQGSVPLTGEIFGAGDLNIGTKQVSSSVLVYKLNKITPPPYRTDTKTTTYPDGLSGTSRIDYYRLHPTAPPAARTMLFVSGFDALDNASGSGEGQTNSASYLAFLGDTAKKLFMGGGSPGSFTWNIAVADFAIGDQPLDDLVGEVGWFGQTVRNYAGVPVQMAGMSMGGALLAQAISLNTGSIRNNLDAWYSVDAPLRGANIAVRIQALITCALDPSDPARKRIRSRAARQMLMAFIDQPGDASCTLTTGAIAATATTSFWSAYYDWLVFPAAAATIPHYAVVLGDAEGTTFKAMKSGGGTLLKIDGSLGDGNYPGTKRDCLAGSRFITTSDINGFGTFSDLSFFHAVGSVLTGGLPDIIFNTSIDLGYEPAFINIDSALGTDCVGSDFNEDSSCSSTYTSTAIAGSRDIWTGVMIHDSNAYHALPPDAVIQTAVVSKVNCNQSNTCT